MVSLGAHQPPEASRYSGLARSFIIWKASRSERPSRFRSDLSGLMIDATGWREPAWFGRDRALAPTALTRPARPEISDAAGMPGMSAEATMTTGLGWTAGSCVSAWEGRPEAARLIAPGAGAWALTGAA